MKYEYKINDGVVTFTLEGSMLGDNESKNLKNDFANLLEAGSDKFAIDLTNLKHINSTGLGVFISLLPKLKSKGAELVICNPSTSISNLMKITKLNTIFSIHASVEEGINALKK